MSGSLVLDCQALSKLVAQHRDMEQWIAFARVKGLTVVTSAVTLVEARDPKARQAAVDFALSRVRILPVSEGIARSASKLLADENLHGHKYAIDAVLAATAHLETGEVTLLTSDVDDLSRLCLPRIQVESA